MTVAESYRFCQEVARRQAKNFYYSFLLLDAERRRGMCAIYAFMRYCDDLSDGPSEGHAASGGVSQKAAVPRAHLKKRPPSRGGARISPPPFKARRRSTLCGRRSSMPSPVIASPINISST